jgi:hypothetical protein
VDDALSTWLGLREQADAAARSAPLTEVIAHALGVREPLQLLDLGTGTGANVRYLAPRLGGHQQWLIVDRNATLLELIPLRMASWGGAREYTVEAEGRAIVIRGRQLECRIETRRVDLDALDDPTIFAGRHLVTASALLDLASERWMSSLAMQCRAAGTAALFALTYDGRSTCTPSELEDGLIRDLLNLHQRRDKGLGGLADGPDAAECAAAHFAQVGYHVRNAESEWLLSPAEGELQRRLVQGWADAALEMTPTQSEMIAQWLERRLGHIERGRSFIRVGHLDVAAWLPRHTGVGT